MVKCSRTLDNSICYNYENLTFLYVTFNFLYLRVFWLHDARGLKGGGQLEWILFWFPLLRTIEKSKANRKYIIKILLKICCLLIYCWKYVVYMYIYKSGKLVKNWEWLQFSDPSLQKLNFASEIYRFEIESNY